VRRWVKTRVRNGLTLECRRTSPDAG
jgi:hypothetical protein